MAISNPPSLKERLRAARAAFRHDIAEQLRSLGGDVIDGGERLAVELADAVGEGVRVVAGFNEDDVGRAGCSEWLQLRVETADGGWPVLTLGWVVDDNDVARLALYERLTAGNLPASQRGLNAAADVQEGRYARTDAVRALQAELPSAPVNAPSRAVVRLVASREPVVAVVPKGEQQTIEAEFEPAPLAKTGVRQPQLEELHKRLVGAVVARMTEELRQLEAPKAGAGVGGAAKRGVGEAVEWGMLVVSYAAEVLINQSALGAFMGLSDKASQVIGLVGPVVVGGVASISDSKAAKAAGIGLIGAWAVTVAVITASNPERLDAAQAYFGKGQGVVDQEKALALSKIGVEAAERELAKLEKATGVNVGDAIAAARKRWQAEEMKAESRRHEARQDEKLQGARGELKAAKERLTGAEFALREAGLKDGSRLWAWRSLFALCAALNFVGPLAVSRVLEKWRKEHEGRKQARQDEHQAREKAKHLRQGRAEQEAHAIVLLTETLKALALEGIAQDLLEQVNAAALAEQAARNFNTVVNPKRKLDGAGLA